VQCAIPTAGGARETIGGIPVAILVVDDDPTFRRLARRLLAVYGLAVVAEAGSVADGVTTAQSVEPTAALVDVELPDGSGFDLAAQLIAMPWRPRVVMTSAQSSDGFTAQARRAGAEAFVLKDELPRAPLTTWLANG
jgi:DNA-binding NarL/FixJ family response regulator